jgi:hypothetical protein
MIEDPQLNGPDAMTSPANENETRTPRWRRRKPTKKATPRPTHYKVICISMYTKDLEQLDGKVAELKRRGKTKMTKSELIRLALANLNIDEVA